MNPWYRTCQECGAKHYCTPPPENDEKLTSNYLNAKCRKCNSMALDYGMYQLLEEDWGE